MLRHNHSMKSTATLAGSFCAFALACAHPAAAQQADRPTADSWDGTEDIVVAGRPNRPASVELMSSPQDAQTGAPANASADAHKAPVAGMQGYIQGGFGSYGMRTMGGGVSLPLSDGKLHLSIEGYSAHNSVR
jgi:hypothetical protein